MYRTLSTLQWIAIGLLILFIANNYFHWVVVSRSVMMVILVIFAAIFIARTIVGRKR